MLSLENLWQRVNIVHTRSEQAVFPNMFRKEAQSMLLLISAVCGGVYVIH